MIASACATVDPRFEQDVATTFAQDQMRHLVTAALGYATGAFDAPRLARLLCGVEPRPLRADADGLTLHQVLYPTELDPFPDLEALV